MPRKIEPKRHFRRGGFEPQFEFSPEVEKDLRGIVDDDVFDVFIERMRRAIAHYLLTFDNDSSAPNKRQVKAAINELGSNLDQFLHTISSLDQVTTDLIKREWRKAGGKLEDLPRLGTTLAATQLEILYNLQSAIILANRRLKDSPNREPENANHVLTMEVAQILADFGVPVSTSDDGPFNRCLSITTKEKLETTRNWTRWWREAINDPKKG
ncbi:MAG: hypothetical protein RPU62_13755 [Candidatus Sedimenticola sp. (ex Thyasira tokunagai)]